MIDKLPNKILRIIMEKMNLEDILGIEETKKRMREKIGVKK